MYVMVYITLHVYVYMYVMVYITLQVTKISQTLVAQLLEHLNGQFHNCQSWSFITVHGQF